MSDRGLVLSRIFASAESLGDAAEDRHRFLDKRALLTGDAETALTENGRIALLNSMRLLSKITDQVDVFLPPAASSVRAELEIESQLRELGRVVHFCERAEFSDFDAILSIGFRGFAGAPFTVVNSNGWLVRLASDGSNIDRETDQSNAIGALAAACLGVGEVFKRLVKLKPNRGRVLPKMTLSLYTYKAGATDFGPSVPFPMTEPTVLIGAGAIGNGVVELLRLLRYCGRIVIVDRQEIEGENIGTYLLACPSEVGLEKAKKAEAELRTEGIDAVGYTREVDSLGELFPGTEKYPRVVINALDNIPARHAVQRLFWSDLVLDGAIGTFLCQVGRHPWSEDVGCLMCCFRGPAIDSEALTSRATGLSLARIREQNAPITEADVEAAAETIRPLLRANIGRPLCAVVPEAIARQISTENQREGFQPSVPFVACFSACMLMTELARYLRGDLSTLAPRFQFDFLVGPQNGELYPEGRRKDCLCLSAREHIEVLRAGRERY